MSSPIQVVAVAGASGRVGEETVKALLSAGFKVVVLARQGSSSKQPTGAGVHVKTVDYSSRESLVDALKGVQGVASLLAGTGFGLQTALADAALEAGVTRFIPSEFGCDTTHELSQDIPVFLPKIQTRKYIETLSASNPNFSYTAIMTGPFLDFCLEHGLLLSPKGRSAVLVDRGDKPFSTTPIPEAAKAIAAVFKNLDGTKNKVVRTESARLTQLQLLEIGEKLTGTKWEVEQITSEELLATGRAEMQKSSPNPGVFVPAFLKALILDGKGASVYDKVDNELLGLKSLSESDVEAVLKNLL